MRRRRQKNPLLMRIIGISILAHIILLPILAHFGAFKKIQREIIETRLVTLPPPPPEKEKKAEVKQAHKEPHKTQQTARHSASSSHAKQAAQKSNLNQPKVVASAGGPGGGGDDNGPTVEQGTGKAGQLPTEKTDTRPPTQSEATPQPKPEEPKPEPPKVARADIPAQPKPEPRPAASAPEPKKEPVFTEAVPVQSPQPTLPDDLRTEALDKTFVVEFTVASDGTPSNIKVAQSTGNDELDRIGLDTAKQWRFKPATRDGEPVESRIRLHIEFQVS